MVEVVFTYDVPKEKQAAYIKATMDKIKPYWESHGCKAYNVWQALGENSFIKTMEFPDMATLEKVVPANEKSNEGQAIIKLFLSFAENVNRKVYEKKS